MFEIVVDIYSLITLEKEGQVEHTAGYSITHNV